MKLVSSFCETFSVCSFLHLTRIPVENRAENTLETAHLTCMYCLQGCWSFVMIQISSFENYLFLKSSSNNLNLQSSRVTSSHVHGIDETFSETSELLEILRKRDNFSINTCSFYFSCLYQDICPHASF